MSKKMLAILTGAILLAVLIAAGAVAAFSSSSRDEIAMPQSASGGARDEAQFADVEIESMEEAPRAAPAPSLAFADDAAGPTEEQGGSVGKIASAPAALMAEPELISEVAAPTDRKIIRNASLSLIVADLDQAMERIQQIVGGAPGAYISNSDIRDPDSGLPTTLTLRIPSASFDLIIAETKSLAAEVLRDTVNSRDVTEEYTDISSQLRNLEATEAQYLLILTAAEDVEDVLAVQDRLRSVRGEIELLQGRINLLDNQINFSTVTVVLHAPPDISAEIAAAGVPYANSSQTYVVSYRNEGSIEARDVVLVLTLPERMGFDWADFDGKFDPATHTVTWDLDDLGPGTRGSLSLSLRVESSETSLEPAVHISTGTTESQTDNNSSSTTITFFADLSLTVEIPSAVARGEDADLFLNYHNGGTGHAEDVVLTASVPAGMSFVSAGDGGSYDEQSRKISWNLQRLEARDSGTRWAELRMDLSEGDLVVEAEIVASDPDNQIYDNTDQAFLSALKEDVSGRTVWNPGGTVGDSLDALGGFARGAVDGLIWIVTFGLPLAVIAAVGYVIYRFAPRRGGSSS